jgi:hypothetical protein
MLTEAQIQAIKPVRYERRVTDGQGLYLLVTPKARFTGDFAIALPENRRRSLLDPIRWLLSTGLDHVTCPFVTYSPMESIPRR